MSDKSDVWQGTLALMVLKTLETMGPLHGYGIARRIEQVSDHALRLNEGTVYVALTRLRQQGWISASWGASANNRKARFYAITKAGRAQGDRPINFALVGLGSLSTNQIAPALMKTEHARLAGIVTGSPGRTVPAWSCPA